MRVDTWIFNLAFLEYNYFSSFLNFKLIYLCSPGPDPHENDAEPQYSEFMDPNPGGQLFTYFDPDPTWKSCGH